MIHHGDCVEVMAGMAESSVDAIVCDPPYGLEFMGKEWDRLGDVGTTSHGGPADVAAGERGQYGKVSYFGSSNAKCRKCSKWQWDYPDRKCVCEQPDFPNRNRHQGLLMQEWHQRWATEALRVAKPGAYLLAFGGTRTYHRLAVAIEDAGWIIRDCLVWAYASGFPKSRALLKPAWEPIVMARKPGPLRELAIDACRIPGTEAQEYTVKRLNPGATVNATGEWKQDIEYHGKTTAGRWPANVLLTPTEDGRAIFDGDVEGVVGGGEAKGAASQNRLTPSEKFPNGIYHTGMAMPQGWQPSYDDSGTYSRFFLIPKSSRSEREPVFGGLAEQIAGIGHAAGENDTEYIDFIHPPPEGIGSWLREQRTTAGIKQKDVAAHFPSASGGLTGCVANWELELNRPTPDQWRTLREVIGFDGRYDEVMTTVQPVPRVRFKPNGKTQPVVHRRNHHPTVKPLDLMRHLVRLVTPPDGVVLDPFLGSGTTAIAAEMEGFAWIGIEREAEYVAIAEARLQGVQKGLGLDVPAPIPKYTTPPDHKMPPVRFHGEHENTFGIPYDRREDGA